MAHLQPHETTAPASWLMDRHVVMVNVYREDMLTESMTNVVVTHNVPVYCIQQERIRLLELLVSSQCPQQAAALAPPHLESVISYLRACFPVI